MSRKDGDTKIERRTSGEPTASRGRSRSSAARMPAELGAYRVKRRLGAGGMAEIYLAERLLDDGARETVVLKCVAEGFRDDAHFLDMFAREARVAMLLDHPNIVRVFDLVEDEGATALVMEYLDGYTVRDLARTAWKCGVSLPLPIVAAVLKGTCRGLSYAHDLQDESGRPLGLVHRDVAPDNIFVTKSGRVKLLDFGLAKPKEGEALTQAGEIKGKLRFMSPEQLKGKDTDARTDVFSLGVTAYWLLTGARPFDGPADVDVMHAILDEDPKSPRKLNPKLPPALEDLILQCLQKDRARRTGSARAMELMLDRAVDAAVADAHELAAFVADVDAMEIPEEPKPPKYACLPAPPAAESTSPKKKKRSIDPSAPTRVVSADDGEVFELSSDDPSRSRSRARTGRRRRDAALTAALTGVDIERVEIGARSDDDDGSFEDEPTEPPVPKEATVQARPDRSASAPAAKQERSSSSLRRKQSTPEASEETRTLGPAAAAKIVAQLEEKRAALRAEREDADHPRIEREAPPATSTGHLTTTDPANITATERVRRREQSSAGGTAGALIGAALAFALVVVATAAAMKLGYVDKLLANARRGDALVTAPEPAPVASRPTAEPVDTTVPAPAVKDPAATAEPPAATSEPTPTSKEPVAATEPPTTTPTKEPAPPVLDAVRPVESKVDTPSTKEPPKVPAPPVVEPKRKPTGATTPPKAAAAKVRLDGPASVKWSTVDGKYLGQGAVIAAAVPEGTTSVVAVDGRRGVRSAVPVKDGVADYAALPKGELVVRARPWADVTLGIEALGQTPITGVPLVAGTYKVELVWNDVKKVKSVKVAPGEKASLQVDMREP